MMYPARKNHVSNPYNLLLTRSLEDENIEVDEYSLRRSVLGDYDLFHVHWPDWWVRGNSARGLTRSFISGLVRLTVVRVRRKPIVWTVHNVEPHGSYSPHLLRLLHRLLARWVSLTIHLTRATQPALEASGSPTAALPHVVIPHGLYPKGVTCTKEEARVRLGIPPDVRTMVVVGKLNRYKGADQMIRVWPTRVRGTRLYVVGEPQDADFAAELSALANERPDVHLLFRPVPGEDYETWLVAADCVGLPYRKIHNSGSALHALSLSRRVLAPTSEAFEELAEAAGRDWVSAYEHLTWAVVTAALESRTGTPDMSSFAWPAIGARTRAAYETVLRADSGGKTSSDPRSAFPESSRDDYDVA